MRRSVIAYRLGTKFSVSLETRLGRFSHRRACTYGRQLLLLLLLFFLSFYLSFFHSLFYEPNNDCSTRRARASKKHSRDPTHVRPNLLFQCTWAGPLFTSGRTECEKYRSRCMEIITDESLECNNNNNTSIRTLRIVSSSDWVSQVYTSDPSLDVALRIGRVFPFSQSCYLISTALDFRRLGFRLTLGTL